MVIYLILALAVAILAVIFALQNITAVTISFFAWQVSGSLSLVLLLALGIGFLVGVLVMAPSVIRTRVAASGERKQKSTLEKELENIKARLDGLLAEKDELAARLAALLDEKKTLEEKLAALPAAAQPEQPALNPPAGDQAAASENQENQPEMK